MQAGRTPPVGMHIALGSVVVRSQLILLVVPVQCNIWSFCCQRVVAAHCIAAAIGTARACCPAEYSGLPYVWVTIWASVTHPLCCLVAIRLDDKAAKMSIGSLVPLLLQVRLQMADIWPFMQGLLACRSMWGLMYRPQCFSAMLATSCSSVPVICLHTQEVTAFWRTKLENVEDWQVLYCLTHCRNCGALGTARYRMQAKMSSRRSVCCVNAVLRSCLWHHTRLGTQRVKQGSGSHESCIFHKCHCISAQSTCSLQAC